MRLGQQNFSKGEISPDLEARVDVATRGSGLRRGYNVFGLKYGGVMRRPGTRLVAEVHDPANPVRLVPFQFSLLQSYAIEMGQGYARFAAMGGMVLEQATTITAITKAASALVSAAYHGLSVGDEVFFSGILGMIEINGLIGAVQSVPDAGTFTVNINTAGFSTFTGDSGGVTNSAPPPPPPTPPTVPAPTPAPAPAPVGGGSPPAREYYCVSDDTLILMADGTDCPAANLAVGDMLWTRHEFTMEWGKYPIEAIDFAVEEVFKADGCPRATPDHRFWVDGEWKAMAAIGKPDGIARVAKITVTDAHTYMSMGILSHNIKQYFIP